MGGEGIVVSDDTTTTALGAVISDPVMVRKQIRHLDLHGKSSVWLERGVNPATVETVLNGAAGTTKELTGGTITAGIVTGDEAPAVDMPIKLSPVKINHILSTSLTIEQVTDIFDRLTLAYIVDDSDQLTVIASTRWRDINLVADLYEEIARVYGYNSLPLTLPTMTRNRGGPIPCRRFTRASRYNFEGMDSTQVISHSLAAVGKAKQLQIEPFAEPAKPDLPIGSDHAAAWMNIVSGLFNDIAYNVA